MTPRDKAEKLQELYRSRGKVMCNIEEKKFRIEKINHSIQEDEQTIKNIDNLIFIVDATTTSEETTAGSVS